MVTEPWIVEVGVEEGSDVVQAVFVVVDGVGLRGFLIGFKEGWMLVWWRLMFVDIIVCVVGVG